MIIPKKLKIGGHLYIVKFEKEGKLSSSDSFSGMQDPNDQTITLNASQRRTEQEATFFHEIFHAINANLDHVLLESLSQQIYQVFKDNGLLAQKKIKRYGNPKKRTA